MNPTPVVTEADSRFEVRASAVPGAGLGLFARVALPARAELEVVGVLVEPLGFGGMANHSDAPNAEREVRGDRVFLRTLRPVAAGEEVFLCYRPAALERMGIA